MEILPLTSHLPIARCGNLILFGLRESRSLSEDNMILMKSGSMLLVVAPKSSHKKHGRHGHVYRAIATVIIIIYYIIIIMKYKTHQ